MVSVTVAGSGFVLLRFGLPVALKVYELPPVWTIDALMFTPLITPLKAKLPGPVDVNEPGGIVTV